MAKFEEATPAVNEAPSPWKMGAISPPNPDAAKPAVQIAPVAAPVSRASTSEGPAVPRRKVSIADFAGIKRDSDEAKDNLFVPPEIIPNDIVVEWKRMATYNKEDKAHMAELRRKGWRAVPSDAEGFADHFQSFISPGSDIIEFEGMILMMRPKYMSDAARKEQTKKASSLVIDKMDEMGMTSKHKDIPGKKFALDRGFEERLDGGNPAAIKVPE